MDRNHFTASESALHAEHKVARQRERLAAIRSTDPQRIVDEERILVTMIENATIAGMAEAFGCSE